MESVQIDTLTSTGPYSKAIIHDNLVYVSGHGSSKKSSIEAQTRKTLENIGDILSQANSDFDNILKTTIYLTDIRYYEQVNEIYEEFIAEPYPARSTVEVSSLPLKEMKVEIEVIASIPNDSN